MSGEPQKLSQVTQVSRLHDPRFRFRLGTHPHGENLYLVCLQLARSTDNCFSQTKIMNGTCYINGLQFLDFIIMDKHMIS